MKPASKPLAPVQPAALPVRSAQPASPAASPQIPFDFLYKINIFQSSLYYPPEPSKPLIFKATF